ncbi:MAG: carbohydrate binding domain-containing protein [Candidatus Omnitrophota bacterium]
MKKLPEWMGLFVFGLVLSVPVHSAASAPAENLAANGSFEVDADNNGLADDWLAFPDVNFRMESDSSVDGKFSQKIICKGQNGIFQRIRVERNTAYVISAYLKTDGTRADIRLYKWDVQDPWGWPDEKIIGNTTSGDWVAVKQEYTTGPDQDGLVIKLLHQPNTPGDAWFDNVEIKEKREGPAPEVKKLLSEKLTFEPVDISAFFNRTLVDEVAGDSLGGWDDDGPVDARALKLGKTEYFGIPFGIGSWGLQEGVDANQLMLEGKTGQAVISLFGTKKEFFPLTAGPMSVGSKKYVRLYFLHTATWVFPDLNNKPIARYVLAYEDGSSETIPLVIGRNVNNWWVYPNERLPDAKIVHIADNPHEGAVGGKLALFVYAWSNPHPDNPIRNITFESLKTEASPKLFAVTGLVKPESEKILELFDREYAQKEYRGPEEELPLDVELFAKMSGTKAESLMPPAEIVKGANGYWNFKIQPLSGDVVKMQVVDEKGAEVRTENICLASKIMYGFRVLVAEGSPEYYFLGDWKQMPETLRDRKFQELPQTGWFDYKIQTSARASPYYWLKTEVDIREKGRDRWTLALDNVYDKFALYVNGTELFYNLYGWVNPKQAWYYSYKFDVTDLLRAGKNEIVIKGLSGGLYGNAFLVNTDKLVFRTYRSYHEQGYPVTAVFSVFPEFTLLFADIQGRCEHFRYTMPKPATCDLGLREKPERPAGRHGFLKAVGDKLQFEDGTKAEFFGFDMGGSGREMFRGKDRIDELVDLAASMGSNIFRIFVGAGPEGYFYDYGPGFVLNNETGEINPHQLDLVHYFISELEKKGMYVYLTMSDYKVFTETDEDGKVSRVGAGWTKGEYANGMSNMMNPDCIRWHKTFMKNFMNTKNPYNGKVLKDDPGIAFVGFNNEHGLSLGDTNWEGSPPVSYRRFKNLWNAFLVRKYGSRAVLEQSWGELLKTDEDPVRETVAIKGLQKPLEKFQNKRQDDVLAFVYEVSVNYLKDIEGFLKNEVGVKVPVGTCFAFLPPEIRANNDVSDFLAWACYFGGYYIFDKKLGRWVSYSDSALTNTAGWINAIKGPLEGEVTKPVVWREWGALSTNRLGIPTYPATLLLANKYFDHVHGFMGHSIAGLYVEEPDSPNTSSLPITSNPFKRSVYAFTAYLFWNTSVPPGPGVLDTKAGTWVSSDGKCRLEHNKGTLNGHLVADYPHLQMILGNLGDSRQCSLSLLSVRSLRDEVMGVIAVALDNQPLDQSRHIAVCSEINGEVSLRSGNTAQPEIYAVNCLGARIFRISPFREKEVFSFYTLDNYEVAFYEVLWK